MSAQRKPDDPAGHAPAEGVVPEHETVDPVDEAGVESFPASDPPPWIPLHPGSPAPPQETSRRQPGQASASDQDIAGGPEIWSVAGFAADRNPGRHRRCGLRGRPRPADRIAADRRLSRGRPRDRPAWPRAPRAERGHGVSLRARRRPADVHGRARVRAAEDDRRARDGLRRRRPAGRSHDADRRHGRDLPRPRLAGRASSSAAWSPCRRPRSPSSSCRTMASSAASTAGWRSASCCSRTLATLPFLVLVGVGAGPGLQRSDAGPRAGPRGGSPGAHRRGRPAAVPDRSVLGLPTRAPASCSCSAHWLLLWARPLPRTAPELSPPIGAFLAGMVVGESDFRHQIEAKCLRVGGPAMWY